jgi:hypothetical protein
MDFVRKNEEMVMSFLKALIEAIHFFKTEKQKSCAILARAGPLIGLEAEDEIDYLHSQWSRLLCAKPYPDPLAVWNLYELDVARTRRPTPSALETWDTHYVRMIDDSGFIDALYRDS